MCSRGASLNRLHSDHFQIQFSRFPFPDLISVKENVSSHRYEVANGTNHFIAFLNNLKCITTSRMKFLFKHAAAAKSIRFSLFVVNQPILLTYLKKILKSIYSHCQLQRVSLESISIVGVIKKTVSSSGRNNYLEG